jgi:putative ABC transport system permease protein
MYIVNVILREVGMIACAGIVSGMILTVLVRALIWHFNASFTFMVPAEWWFIGAGIALVSALLGALYPALKAASKDPIDALAYE